MPGNGVTFEFELTGGATVRARAGIAANGVHYRRLEAQGVDELIGAGVHYGASPSEAALCRNCDVIVVGGANSAGQAALHLADVARSVTVVCRSDSLERGMSRYLVDRIAGHERIRVRTARKWSRRAATSGSDRSSSATRAATRIEAGADALFVMIGAQPMTAGWRAGSPRRARFLVTGPDLLGGGQAHGHSTARHSTSSRASQVSSSPATYATARSSASHPRSAKARWPSRSSTSTWTRSLLATPPTERPQ